MKKFFDFCDKHKIGFVIHFRENFSDPNARFYLTFDSLLDLHYFDIDGEKTPFPSEFQRFHFENGSTPNEAIANTMKFLKGKVIRIVKFDNENNSVHIFCKFS